MMIGMEHGGDGNEFIKELLPTSITPDMTILDVVSMYRRTECVFKEYDKKAGVPLLSSPF